MSQITNKDAVKAIFDGARMPLQDTPSELGKTCVPVMDMTPRFHRISNIVRGGSTTGTNLTIYTVPTTKEFYLCGAMLSVIKDVLAVSATTRMLLTVDGVSYRLIEIPGITLTPQDRSISISIVPPIKVDFGSTISITNSSATANILSTGNIFGYEKEIN
jgi:hypothetical protein